MTSANVGPAVSITNSEIVNKLLSLPDESVTLIVQSEYVPSLNEFSVTVLFPDTAEVVPEEQDPP